MVKIKHEKHQFVGLEYDPPYCNWYVIRNSNRLRLADDIQYDEHVQLELRDGPAVLAAAPDKDSGSLFKAALVIKKLENETDVTIRKHSALYYEKIILRFFSIAADQTDKDDLFNAHIDTIILENALPQRRGIAFLKN